MAEPVIVATARTPIGRAAKGSLVDVRPDDMSAFIIDDVLGKVPELPREQVEDVLWGIGQPGGEGGYNICLLYTSPSPRDRQKSRMPSSA